MKNIFFLFFLFPLFVFALDCEDPKAICQNLSSQDCLKALQDCEKIFEEKIKLLEGEIGKAGQKKKTLANEISILKKKIEKINFEIYQTKLAISLVNFQIQETEKSIQKTKERIDHEKKRLSEILRAMYEAQKTSPIEILIFEKNLSVFFDNLFYLERLQQKSKNLLELIKNLKQNFEDQKEALEREKESAEKLLNLQVLQEKELKETQEQKNSLLKLTENEYQKLLKEKKEVQQKAAQIRQRIFELIGVEEAPTFGRALEIAKWVEKITGVRPAFLLAVLTQESNLGKNVGQCYLKDPKTGKGIKIKTGQEISRVMAPGPPYSKRNDVFYFFEITKELNKDPYLTPVSCPMAFGWGGAMGPAQFLPTTWIQYKERLSQILGRTPNPWRIEDSFLAAGLFLADHGASKKTPDAEWRATLIYFSGTTNPAFGWYAKSVFTIASRYEQDIKILQETLAQVFLKSQNYWF